MDNALDAVRAFLEAHSTLALATVSADGLPQVAPLFYVSDDDLNLYWLSSQTSRHSINLAAQPQAAATIYPDVWQWTDIRGVQVEGRAEIVRNPQERQTILARYQTKFKLPAAFDSQIAISALYILRPTWIRWLDNAVQFGYKAEWTF